MSTHISLPPRFLLAAVESLVTSDGKATSVPSNLMSAGEERTPVPQCKRKPMTARHHKVPQRFYSKTATFFFLQYKLSTKTRPSPEPKASPRPPALKQTCALKNHKKEGHPNILDIVIFQDSNKSGYLCTIY